jgi:hypothetical protein
MNIISRVFSYQSRGKAVGMAIRLRAGRSGVRMPVGTIDFLQCPHILLERTQPPIL